MCTDAPKFGYNLSAQNKMISIICRENSWQTRMWANAQRDGRPAKYRWRPLFNAAKFG